MGFEQSALLRLRRYREEASLSLGFMREAEGAARAFSRRLFDGLEHVAKLAREAGFAVEAAHESEVFVVRSATGPGAEAGVVFGLLPLDTPSLDDTRAYLASEREKWGSLVKKLGLEATQ